MTQFPSLPRKTMVTSGYGRCTRWWLYMIILDIFGHIRITAHQLLDVRPNLHPFCCHQGHASAPRWPARTQTENLDFCALLDRCQPKSLDLTLRSFSRPCHGCNGWSLQPSSAGWRCCECTRIGCSGDPSEQSGRPSCCRASGGLRWQRQRRESHGDGFGAKTVCRGDGRLLSHAIGAFVVTRGDNHHKYVTNGWLWWLTDQYWSFV